MIPYGDLFSLPDQPPAQCTLVVDAGFSFTHVVPLLDGQIVWGAVKRCVLPTYLFIFSSRAS